MLDINYIRENIDKIKDVMKRRNLNPKLADKFIKIDKEYRELLAQCDGLRCERNLIQKEINESYREDND